MTTKRGRVFVICEPTHVIGGQTLKYINLAPAVEFGDIEILLPNNQSLFNTVPTVRTLREKLADFNDADFILPVGDPVLMSLVAMVASNINGGRVNFLKWDKKYKQYYSIQTDVYGKAI
jgi:hypothetical protein